MLSLCLALTNRLGGGGGLLSVIGNNGPFYSYELSTLASE